MIYDCDVSQVPPGDYRVYVELEPTCLISADSGGTGHGTAHAYDRDVPIVFAGAGIRSGRVSGAAHTIDIAPTLAKRLGLTPRPDLDGRPLPLE